MDKPVKAPPARELWADALRSLACVMVIVIHVCGTDWYTLPATGGAWQLANVLDSLVRPAVPIFFMLSGSFLLRREPEGKKTLFMALRLFILWLVMYLFYAVKAGGVQLLQQPKMLLRALVFPQEHYHLWFLRTIVCLYLLLPVLRALVAYADGKWVKWYLAVFLLFGILRPSLAQLPFQNRGWGQLFVPELCRYAGCFVLGWYLTARTAPPPKEKRPLYALIYVAVAALIAVGTYFYSRNTAHNDERLYSYLALPVLTMAVCLFQLARTWRDCGLLRLAARFAPLTLGVYVLHPFALDVLRLVGIRSESLPRALFIPAATLGALAVSAGLSWCLRRIPLVKKFF
ncbi:MAG: acyltransferase family protein [Oscillospiraceae bacterium]|nr:acyltransferase family protein [Oscillospiraceae bacterium]